MDYSILNCQETSCKWAMGNFEILVDQCFTSCLPSFSLIHRMYWVLEAIWLCSGRCHFGDASHHDQISRVLKPHNGSLWSFIRSFSLSIAFAFTPRVTENGVRPDLRNSPSLQISSSLGLNFKTYTTSAIVCDHSIATDISVLNWCDYARCSLPSPSRLN